MKNLTLFLFALLAMPLMYAQTPQGINYQAVLRDGSTVIANTQVNVLLAVEDANVNILYEESHDLTTNEFGLINFVIGEGTPVIGSFDQINWGQAGMQFEAEVTYNGTIYSLGRVNFVSVPFSLYADRAKMADSMELGDLLDVSMTPATAGQGLVWNGTAWEAATIGGGAGALNDLSDVTAAPTEAGEILVWDGTEWSVNAGTLVLDSTVSTSTYLGNEMILFGANGTANVVGFSGDDPSLGLLGVVDSFDFIQGFMDVALEGEGRMGTFGPTGLNYLVGGVGTDSELGAVSVWDSASNGKAIMGAGIPGLPSAGFIETTGSNGSTNFTTVGPSTTEGFMALSDDANNLHLITQVSGGAGEVQVWGANGTPNTVISGTDRGAVSLFDEAGAVGIQAVVDAGGKGRIEVRGPNGSPNVRIDALGGGTDNIGYVTAHDTAFGGAGAGMYGNLGGSGFIDVTGSNGFGNVRLSSNIFGSNDNSGSVDVQDSTGFPQAGIYVDDQGSGIVFGDVKNFRMDHPTQPGKEIWYASLEGPEAAAYVRGTAQMVNGEALVAFPEHFAALANAQTMTVVLTPLSADSEGMAVIEKTAQGFKVKELRQGTGSYGFDWEVKCVRQGYENYRAVRDASEYQPAASQAEMRKIRQGETYAPVVAPSPTPANSQRLLPAAVARPKANVQK